MPRAQGSSSPLSRNFRRKEREERSGTLAVFLHLKRTNEALVGTNYPWTADSNS